MQNLYSFNRNHADQTAGKEALKDIDACGFDVGSAVLILYRHIENGYNRTGQNSDHPNSVKSLIVACTQDKSKISAPMLPIMVKKSATAP